MKKEIVLISLGAFLMLVVIGYGWLHFRVRDLELWRLNLILNAQQQQQRQQIQHPALPPTPTQ